MNLNQIKKGRLNVNEMMIYHTIDCVNIVTHGGIIYGMVEGQEVFTYTHNKLSLCLGFMTFLCNNKPKLIELAEHYIQEKIDTYIGGIT